MAYVNQLLENGLKVLECAVVERIDGFRALVRVSFVSHSSDRQTTYAELPLGLPQGFDRALVWVDGVEFLSHHPWRHDEYSVYDSRESRLV